MSQKTDSIEVTTHGRYIVDAPGREMPLLAGFHGYGESAETEFDRLRSIEGSNGWIVVSLQGLHRFYRRSNNEVVASWMTRQDRELAIADNAAYVRKVVATVAEEYSASATLVLTGFSQGVAMAFRSAVAVGKRIRAVIALGGDVPPELDASALSQIQSVLIARGTRDEWYTESKLASDERRLRDAGIDVQAFTFEAGHEWTAEFSREASRFLNAVYPTGR